MKYIIAGIFAISIAFALPAKAQSSPKLAFNQAANLFIEGQNEQALRNVNNALNRYPNDPQLKALKEKLEQQQEQQQQQQQQQQQEQNGEQDQEQSNEQNGESQPQDSQNQEGKEGESNEQQEQQEKEGEGEQPQDQEEQQSEEGEGTEEQEGGELDTERRLEEMNISPEKARMILEAMKSNEVQYLQQKKRKSSSRSNSDKPDW